LTLDAASGGELDRTSNTSGAACDFVYWAEGRGTWPVGQKAANELGLYDMSGNVFEWCFEELYPGHQGSYRVTRSGSWFSRHASECTVSNRYNAYPTNGLSIGFRLARTAG
jgi:formylglycine-generating enzyme required for sulfatase activity